MKEGKLILEDSSEFSGVSFGYAGSVKGEVVFNTGMVGYPESLTDPSYKGQILVLTYPLIGNYGMPPLSTEQHLRRFYESDTAQVLGLVVSDYSRKYGHWQAERSLGNWLKEQKIPGLAGVDTRQLTKKLRDQGTMSGTLDMKSGGWNEIDPNTEDIVPLVSTTQPLHFKAGHKNVAVIDLGCKNSIIRSLLLRNVSVTKVPWDYDASKEGFHGIVLSSGPGDPKNCPEVIDNVSRIMDKGIPILGICLGHQILALATGADTYKLKFGHRSQNQPCLEVGTKRCFITSQNHGYAVDTNTLKERWEPWFFNLNDGSNEGIKHVSKPIFSVQFHPEASPGPTDTRHIFDQFVGAL